LCVSLTSGNRNDITQLIPLVEAIPRVRGRPGRPRHRPRELCADRAYDHHAYRTRLRQHRITPRIAGRGTEHGSGLGRLRWVAEAAIAWLHGPRKLRTRWETRDDIHEGFLRIAHCMILAGKLPTTAF
jgi:hypothetical protein